jgi:hypothetical protein
LKIPRTNPNPRRPQRNLERGLGTSAQGFGSDKNNAIVLFWLSSPLSQPPSFDQMTVRLRALEG